jgi:hypothetical protein
MTEEQALVLLIQGYIDLFPWQCQCWKISNGQQAALIIGKVDLNSEN